ncbi:hypothetical protein BH11MYX3_BH11MYX3_19610 [soil metagenome]
MRALVVLIVLAGCGDQIHQEVVEDAVSGTRLKVVWTFYGDGSRQPETDAYFDIDLPARCAPVLWRDDVDRCAPTADEAFYVDALCTETVGRADVITKPSFFIGYDFVGTHRLPARLYRAGPPTDAITTIYERVDGECRGPFQTTAEVPYFELRDETHGENLVELRDSELGAEDDRIGVLVRTSADGLRVTLGLHDRVLDVPCRASSRPEGTVCKPAIGVAHQYIDSACEQPAIVVFGNEPVGPVLARGDSAGCPAYFSPGPMISGPVYQRVGTTCSRVVLDPLERAYPLGAPLALPILERTVEARPGPRLQRIALASGSLAFYDERMFDTATRGDCERTPFEDVTRCVPSSALPVVRLFTEGCALEIPVAEVPEQTCEPITFAVGLTEEIKPELRAIGDRASSALFTGGPGACTPYVAPAGTVPHLLGPALPEDTFVGGHVAGER